jgi:hypothetical protein
MTDKDDSPSKSGYELALDSQHNSDLDLDVDSDPDSIASRGSYNQPNYDSDKDDSDEGNSKTLKLLTPNMGPRHLFRASAPSFTPAALTIRKCLFISFEIQHSTSHYCTIHFFTSTLLQTRIHTSHK